MLTMRRTVTFGVCLMLVLLGSVGLTLGKSHPLSAPTKSPYRIDTTLTLPRDHGPFLNGVKMSLSDAQAAAGFSFLLPVDPVANDTNIRAVYYEVIPGDPGETTQCSRSPIVHAAIDYESGIVIEEELVAGTGCEFDVDPAAMYLRVVAGNPGWETGTLDIGPGNPGNPGLETGSLDIASVQAPAMFVPEDDQGAASVSYVYRGVKVDLYPDYASFDLAALKRIARSSLLLGLSP